MTGTVLPARPDILAAAILTELWRSVAVAPKGLVNMLNLVRSQAETKKSLGYQNRQSALPMRHLWKGKARACGQWLSRAVTPAIHILS
jgi:hypothetical protein